MRLSRCSRPSGPLERAPLTALWASVATPVAAVPPAVDERRAAPCDAWWTADERYVLRVGGGAQDEWYVGELDALADADAADDAALADVAVAGAATPRPPRDVVPARTRTMLVGRRRVGCAAPGAMRLHVRRPPRA